MVVSKEEIITKFNDQINMTVDELEQWLASDKCHQAGTGVGLESGAKIVDILKKNPDMDREKYDEDDLDHMRKVVGYNSRHLAQEDHLKETKTKEELINAKSTISLKNWGHDPVKGLEDEDNAPCHDRPEEESDKVESGDARRGEKHKREDSDEGPPASKRNRETVESGMGESNGDVEEEKRTKPRNKSKTSRLDKLPTRKSARNRKAVIRK